MKRRAYNYKGKAGQVQGQGRAGQGRAGQPGQSLQGMARQSIATAVLLQSRKGQTCWMASRFMWLVTLSSDR